jgi:broad specificity phosphatase PhoE
MLDFNEFNLLLIRHGQSAVNVIPDQMGQAADVPLTDLGRKQAEQLGERLLASNEEIDYVYSSNYTRALDTCKIAMDVVTNEFGSCHPIKVCPELREYSAGDWEGSKRSEVITLQVALKMGYLNNSFQPPGGESLNQVERRASTWLEQNILYNEHMIADAKTRRQRNLPRINIAMFSHGMTIKALLHYVMGFDQNFTWKITLENTSISRLTFGEEGWRLITINDHAHLL